MVDGMRLDFVDSPPVQNFVPFELNLQDSEKCAIDNEISRLLELDIIGKSDYEHNQYVSTIFARKKKDGKHRMILNLSKLNEHIEYHHFKMDTLEHAISLITPGCYMASIDLKDAYYSVPIAASDQKYLKFIWKGQLYKFKALPNGLTSGPRKFTKLLKPPFSYLRELSHTIIGYIDDTLLIAQSKMECARAVRDTTSLLTDLGFILNTKKSIFVPSHEITFLGFMINSLTMTVRPTLEKCAEITQLCARMIRKQTHTILEVASVVGKLVALFPGAQYGPLHYRELEKAKTLALSFNRGNYKASMSLPKKAIAELQWWMQNVHKAFSCLKRDPPMMTLTSDASGLGWGITDGHSQNGGKWNDIEKSRAANNEINYLELWAAFMGLRAYASHKSNVHVKLLIDNTTAIAYINHMGGTKSHNCNELGKEIWEWCVERKIWLTAFHIPGVYNVVADKRSREFQDQTEWKLNGTVFREICATMGTPDIDLFASRLNTQMPIFVSWRPDPDAYAVDAFSLNWAEFSFYAFPPFCLIAKCLQKISFDQAEGVMILPKWPTQPWYGRMLQMLVHEAMPLKKSRTLLIQPGSDKIHPLHNKLTLLCCRLSGDPLRPRASLMK